MSVGDMVTAPAARPGGTREISGRLLCAVLTSALLFQAPLYLARPSLLLDEARLALNIASRSWWDLTRPLDYDQAAPLLFLWLSKLVTLVGGTNEYSLRALPFLAGASLAPLLYVVGRRMLDWRAGVLAALLGGVSPLVLQFVRQVKPYTLDALLALGLVWLALECADNPDERPRLRRWALAGALAVWASTPAIFVLAGALAALWLAFRGFPRARVRVLATGALIGGSFACAYFWTYKPASQNAYMQQFWGSSMLMIGEVDLPARLWQGTREVVWQTFAGGSTEPPLAPLADAIVDGSTATILLLMSLGLSRMWSLRGPTPPLLLGLPVVIAYGASLAGSYPIAARVMLFALPGLVLATAAGVLATVERLPRRLQPPGTLVLCGALLALSLPVGVRLMAHPRSFEDVRSATVEYERRARFTGAIYVFASALPAWTFYTTNWNSPDYARLRRMARLASSGGPAFENAPPREHPIKAEESDSLRYPIGSATEILGRFSGAQWRSGVGHVQRHPDPSWTDEEARRIAAAAAEFGSVWMLASHTYGFERDLFHTLQGLCADYVFRNGGALLVHLVPVSVRTRCLPRGSAMGTG
jgi:hypothetical protein